MNFCTLFDSNYLSRGLAMYYSLEKVCDDFHLYIFAFDSKTESILKQLNLNHATIISLKDFEDDELLKVKSTRTIAEYCWTSTSSTILYAIEKYNLPYCTYLDADLFFYSSPKPIFEEMGDASILLTEHRYTKRYDKSRKSGKYCVQFITFKNNEFGLKALKWWRDQCINWCYNRIEDGKFGDQKYLDDWTTRFEGVHVLGNLGTGVAAWNVQQYNFNYENDKLFLKEISTQNKFQMIFYHFHYLRFYKNNKIELGRRTLSNDVLNLFYRPYILELDKIKNSLLKYDSNLDSHGASIEPQSLKTPFLFLFRKLLGIYNIYQKEKFLS